MQFEHLALNVPDALGMAKWYSEHLNMTAVVANDAPPYAHFMADATGRVVMEIYTNANLPIPDYAEQDVSRLHVAFAVENAEAVKDACVAGGASVVDELNLDDGSHLFMLRDPWSLPLQLCQRAKPMPLGKA